MTLGLLASGIRDNDPSAEAVRGSVAGIEANGLSGARMHGPEVFGHVAVQPCTSPSNQIGPCGPPITERQPTTSTVAVPPPTSKSEQVTTSSLPRPTTSAPNTTQPAVTTTESGGSYLGRFDATCYALSGITASGRPVGPGAVAVDPDVIPMGTSLEVEGYGHGVAADTGSAIVGHRIDVWKPTNAECSAWGRQQVDVWATS